jgi:hypothetical protein
MMLYKEASMAQVLKKTMMQKEKFNFHNQLSLLNLHYNESLVVIAHYI